MQHRNLELYSCISSESWQFGKRAFVLKQISVITGDPLERRARGNCLHCRPPFNPALPTWDKAQSFMLQTLHKSLQSETSPTRNPAPKTMSRTLHKITSLRGIVVNSAAFSRLDRFLPIGTRATPTNLHKLTLSIKAACVVQVRGPKYYLNMRRVSNENKENCAVFYRHSIILIRSSIIKMVIVFRKCAA